MKLCGQPGCPQLTQTPRCPQHTPKPWHNSTRNKQLPKNWTKTRLKILNRDRACLRCGSTKNLEVDHINNPMNHHPSNLQTLCGGPTGCHTQKTLREAAAGRTKEKPQ